MGIALVVGSIMMGGGGLGPFVDLASIMIVVGGALAALLINFPLSSVFGVVKVVKNCFFVQLPDPKQTIERFKEFALIVRKDGILALEAKLDELTDSFLKRGLEMVVAGTSRDDLQSALETEVGYIVQRHASGKKILDSLAAAAPGFGMIGTLIGLVQMLRTLDDPGKIGGGMAVALLTTLYGALIANLLCLPLAGKLEARSAEEVSVRELMIAGMVGLVDGQTPRALEERLMAYTPPSVRREMQSKAA